MTDEFDLARFVKAQQGVYDRALAELRQGRKGSHWMWFIFPQLRGLGQSQMAWQYGISGLEEARAYLAHALLGARLRESTEAVNEWTDKTASQIFGYPDDLKFRSSMTLFAEAEGYDSVFGQALRNYFQGKRDAVTIEKLRRR